MSLNLRRLNKRSPKFVTLEVVNAQPQNRRQAVTSQQKYRIIEVPRTAKSQGAPNSAGTQTVVVTTRSAVKVDMSGGSMPQQQAVSGCVSSSQEDIFVRRLIEAVKAEPCLYNPNHEHYGNKHSSAQYRSAVWRRLCIDLNFQDDPHALQMQWKRVRDRFVRERKKRRSLAQGDGNSHQDGTISRERHPSGGSTCSTSSGSTTSAASRHYELMKWIEPFLLEMPTNSNPPNQKIAGSSRGVGSSPNIHSPNVVQSQLPSQSPSQNGAIVVSAPTTSAAEAVTYYVESSGVTQQEATEPTAVKNSQEVILLNNFEQLQNDGSSTASQSQNDFTSSTGGASLTNGSSDQTKNSQEKVSKNAASPCSSTSSEIDVGTASSFAAQQQSSQQQAQQIPQPQQQNMILLTPVSQHAKPTPPQAVFSKTDPQPRIGQPITTADGSIVTVTARGTAPLTSIVKKDVSIRTNDGGTVTMIIDPTTFYQHGSQKMYRLVNVSELNPDLLPSASGGNASTNEVKVIGIPPRRKRVAAASVQGMSNGRGQLGDDLILDDGIGEKTVTIDPALIAASPPPIANDRVLLDHHSNVQSSSSGMVLSQHNVQQVHHQQQLGSAQQQHHQGVMGSLRHQQQQTQGRFVAQQVAVQQPQYTVLATQPVQSQFEQELIFANSIATHLSRLNEDEKAVAKMNIQRILMDARFGMGACARMINDEELSEAAANSSAHDIVTSQQQIAATPPRRRK